MTMFGKFLAFTEAMPAQILQHGQHTWPFLLSAAVLLAGAYLSWKATRRR